MKILQRLIFTLFVCVAFLRFASAQSDIETIKQRIVKELISGEIDDEQVKNLIVSINQNGTWPGINYANVSREGFEHRFHLENMLTLARAFKLPASEYKNSTEVLEIVELALLNWVENDYFCENWWHNQINTPKQLVTLMLLLGDELDNELVEKAQAIIGRANIEAGGARPGGDRIKIAGIQAENCLFLGDDKMFDEVIRVIEGEIKYVEWTGAKYGFGFRKTVGGFENRFPEGRGIQYDNSFHHRVDGVNNTLSYGISYAAAFAEWAAYVHGTSFSFSEEKTEQLIDYFLDGICKTEAFGRVPDPGAKNRSISREGALTPYNAALPEKLLSVSNYRKSELQEIIDIRTKGIKPSLSHATFFWNSEHFSYQRPNWFASVRMYSTRNNNMEQPYNSEGFLNYHRADGTNHISVDADEYVGLAPVMDYQKIPGTTVMQKPKMLENEEVSLQMLGLTDFVGAVTDGKYGAAAFDFRSPHDPLIARKAWFFFEYEYVCMGAGISCKEKELPVVTTLNQCLLKGGVSVLSEGKIVVLNKDERELENVDWIFHNKVGYVFTEPLTVNLKNSTESGSWYRINRQTDSPKDKIELDVFKLWLDHGQCPSEESYQYIVVPATDIESLQNNTSKNNLEILINTPELQAVKQMDLGICQLVFYKAGEIKISENLTLSTDNPGIVMVKFDGEKVNDISVTDPNRELLKFHLSVTSRIEKQGENFVSSWNEKVKRSEIAIDLPQDYYAGSSVTVKL